MMLRFIKKLGIFTLITGLAGWGLFSLLPAEWQTPAYPYIVLFFFSVTLLMHRLLVQAYQQRFARFTSRFMLITFVKLMLYLIVLAAYVFLVNPSDAKGFLVAFLVMYMAFLAFEAVEMMKMA